MAADFSARLNGTPPRGRRFGLEIGVAAAVASALLLRRQHVVPATACLLLSLLVVGVAVFWPTALDPVARHWLAFAAALARVTTPLVLAILYFVVVTPMALLRRTLGKSPLERDRRASSYWISSTSRSAEERRARMERQF